MNLDDETIIGKVGNKRRCLACVFNLETVGMVGRIVLVGGSYFQPFQYKNYWRHTRGSVQCFQPFQRLFGTRQNDQTIVGKVGKVSQIDPRKFIGRKSSPCSKCGGVVHYVNSLGEISCQTCYPPRQSHHWLLILVSEAGTWSAEGEAFLSGDNSSGLTAPPQAESAAAIRRNSPPFTGENSTQTSPPISSDAVSPDSQKVVVRRKSSEPYTEPEIAWMLCRGGILDQMAESVARRPYRPPISRPGETIEERDARIEHMASGTLGGKRRRFEQSIVGAVHAELTVDLQFVIAKSEPRRLETFPAGTACLLFPKRVVPERDPEAAVIRGSLASRGREAARLAVIRLDGKLRIVDEHMVAVGVAP